MSRKYTWLVALVVLSFCLACHSGNGANPGPPNHDAIESTADRPTSRGEELFRQRCITCHGTNGNFRNNNAADLQLARIDSLTIANTIKNGKGAMPMFAGTLTDSDIAELEMYVKTLRQ